MTQAITNKSQMTSKPWRRNTDSPGLWIAVFIGSISLHLLGFFLLRTYGLSISSVRHSTRVVPIEFVKVPKATKQSTAKPVSPQKQAVSNAPKPKVTPDKSAVQKSPNQGNSDTNGIALSNKSQGNTPKEKLPKKQESSPKTSPSPKVEKKPPVVPYDINSGKTVEEPQPTPSATEKKTPKPEFTPQIPENQSTPTPTPEFTPQIPENQSTPTPTPEFTPQIPENQSTPTPTPEFTPQIPKPTPPDGGDVEKPWENREEIELGEGQKIPENPKLPSENSPDNQAQGVLVASYNPLPRSKVMELKEQGTIHIDSVPDILAEPTSNTENNLDPSFLARYPSLQPAQILASLVINNQGKFIEAGIISVESTAAQADTTTYKQFVNNYFSQQTFIPARNNDDTQPELSNLIVKVEIRRQKPQPVIPGSMGVDSDK